MVKQAIDQAIKTAMLAGDKRQANALRNFKSAILNAEVNSGKRDVGLGDDEVIALLQKEQKKRVEAAALYDKGGNEAAAAEERYEAELIQAYLPEQLDEAGVNTLIDEALMGLGEPLTPQVMGRVIGAVKQAGGAAVDGGMVARLVKARLG